MKILFNEYLQILFIAELWTAQSSNIGNVTSLKRGRLLLIRNVLKKHDKNTFTFISPQLINCQMVLFDHLFLVFFFFFPQKVDHKTLFFLTVPKRLRNLTMVNRVLKYTRQFKSNIILNLV